MHIGPQLTMCMASGIRGTIAAQLAMTNAML